MRTRRSPTQFARRVSLFATCLSLAVTASAHPPYEHLERTVTAEDGRQLQLLKSYVDGIFMTDPVKLVVREADDRTLLETEYGRDLAVVCWQSRPCLIFRYDGILSVIPTNIWRLERGRLHDARSRSLLALGVVVPLWDNAGGYVASLVFLAVPVLAFWLVSRAREPRRRILLQAGVSVVGVPYCIWLYTVTLLSRLSLPLVVVVCATVWPVALFTPKAAVKAGFAESMLLRLARNAALVVAALAGVAVIGVLILSIRIASYSSSISFDEPPVQVPLAKARVTRVKGPTTEVFATLAGGVNLGDMVNLDLFDGFDPQMSREDAERRLGPPSGRWTDPAYELESTYYDRPGGRVSLVRQGASYWSTVGHPSACTHDYVFRDSRLRNQILAWLPPAETVQVNVLRKVGWGGLTVFMSRASCSYLVLTARDGDPD